MEFNFRLVIPEFGTGQSQPFVSFEDLDVFEDDDPQNPLSLTRTCRILEANGVRFQIDGFFADSIPLFTSDDLPYFLGDLPALLEFALGTDTDCATIGLWEQGTETEFEFARAEVDSITINVSTRTTRVLKNTSETVSKSDMVKRLLNFVDTYFDCLRRFEPSAVENEWNRQVIHLSQKLRAGIDQTR